MIQYKPDNVYFHWDLPDSIPSEHWQEVITNIPYDELARYLNNNPAIKYAIWTRLQENS